MSSCTLNFEPILTSENGASTLILSNSFCNAGSGKFAFIPNQRYQSNNFIPENLEVETCTDTVTKVYDQPGTFFYRLKDDCDWQVKNINFHLNIYNGAVEDPIPQSKIGLVTKYIPASILAVGFLFLVIELIIFITKLVKFDKKRFNPKLAPHKITSINDCSCGQQAMWTCLGCKESGSPHSAYCNDCATTHGASSSAKDTALHPMQRIMVCDDCGLPTERLHILHIEESNVTTFCCTECMNRASDQLIASGVDPTVVIRESKSTLVCPHCGIYAAVCYCETDQSIYCLNCHIKEHVDTNSKKKNSHEYVVKFVEY